MESLDVNARRILTLYCHHTVELIDFRYNVLQENGRYTPYITIYYLPSFIPIFYDIHKQDGTLVWW